MYKKTYLCKIVYKKEIAPKIIDMKIESSEIAQNAKCGQFLNIKCSEGLDAVLRRPISICDIDKEQVRFIFQIKGKGTLLLSQKNIGDYIDVLGPLGNSFDIGDKYKKPLIIGGGIGTFPLLYLAKSLKHADVCLGFRDKQSVLIEDDFKQVSNSLNIATEDGSLGHKGYVTEIMESKIRDGGADSVYACGPEPMLKNVQKICENYNVNCQLSLEQRMGCGIGACLVCSCKIKSKSKDTKWEYKRVCKDGPVFWGSEVIFDD